MMAYCFMRFEKVKSIANFTRKMEHNFRIKPVPNADPERQRNNRELVKMVTDDYASEYKRLIEKYKCKPRKDAVKGLEFVLSYNGRDKNDKMDVDKWEKANVEWLKKTFGDENVVSVVSHHDEGPKGAVHIHAMVIPMVNGRLCAKELISGRAKLSAMQTSYANDMKQFGLERGIQGTSMKHTDIAKWYAALNKEVKKELPKPYHGEKTEDYFERVKDTFYVNNAKNFDKIKKLERKITEMEARHKNELIGDRNWYTNRIDILQLEKEKEMEEKERKEKRILELEKKIENDSKYASEYKALLKAIGNIEDVNKREQIKKNIDGLIDWQLKEDRKNER